ncbi:hypothetical protein QAD02_010988 [Eretmocerus hayati]|uniref:Uncharacterized protein n=1 Tax=Eretmocerus hayati TaxID=131215 RepID=A0ACC2NVP0_9HYME|nr:hypothetical protein QAD02_010988 [Eretmocerus hayati]
MSQSQIICCIGIDEIYVIEYINTAKESFWTANEDRKKLVEILEIDMTIKALSDDELKVIEVVSVVIVEVSKMSVGTIGGVIIVTVKVMVPEWPMRRSRRPVSVTIVGTEFQVTHMVRDFSRNL